MSHNSIYYALPLLGVMFLVAFGCSGTEEREVLFFYETICATCDETEQTQRLLTRVMEVRRRNEGVSAEIFNVNSEAGKDALAAAAARRGLRADSVRLPALFVKDGEVYQGELLVDAFLSPLE